MCGLVIFVLICTCFLTIKCEVFDCHDDPGYEPEEGLLRQQQFTWLGVLQYIHIKNGNPHYFRVPRVVLISRQFVLSTAIDASEVPQGYALGNVAFGDYERDESECGVSVQDIAEGVPCEPAILLMPIADVLVHPEYTQLAIRSSIALLKLITAVKSNYMLPVCLPYKNILVDKFERTMTKVLHLDFFAGERYEMEFTDVPRDFIEEGKEVTSFNIIPRNNCKHHRWADADVVSHEVLVKNSTNMTSHQLICSTGCGFHSGAPSIYHEHTGHWTVILLSSGGPPCPDPLGSRRARPPPHHIAIYPYLSWITNSITGRTTSAFADDDPFGFVMPRSSDTRTRTSTWVGHWWMGGLRCYDRGQAADDLRKFYHEIFALRPKTESVMTYYLEIEAPPDMIIVCVKVGMPYTHSEPTVWNLDTSAIKLRIPVIKFKTSYKFQVEAWGCKKQIEVDKAEDDYSDDENNSDKNEE